MRALALLAILCAPGCYLSHERATPTDASRPDAGLDAFRPIDVGIDAPPARVDTSAACELPGICPTIENVLRLDRVARDWGDDACARLELQFDDYPPNPCHEGPGRVAVARCVDGVTRVRVTVTQIGADTEMESYEFVPDRCDCHLYATANIFGGVGSEFPVPPGSDEDGDGVTQYAFRASDITVLVEACAF